MYSPMPWKNTNGTIESVDGWHVASVHGHVGPETKKSNGNLIADAPELLESLKEMLRHHDHGQNFPHLCRARAAIAKARGESC